eukprot:TRINITY_DN14526_c0_g2_i2.p2 TRINITY_DN14526_c0_g2~~TRINITY_DN14526_c0_g2_i2.p2  ORF type:complete len:171 (-),score=38.99 TRINITY_DN14526_c0_g2_i2:58-570(-)
MHVVDPWGVGLSRDLGALTQTMPGLQEAYSSASNLTIGCRSNSAMDILPVRCSSELLLQTPVSCFLGDSTSGDNLVTIEFVVRSEMKFYNVGNKIFATYLSPKLFSFKYSDNMAPVENVMILQRIAIAVTNLLKDYSFYENGVILDLNFEGGKVKEGALTGKQFCLTFVD